MFWDNQHESVGILYNSDISNFLHDWDFLVFQFWHGNCWYVF